ncbi:AAA domain-containing protein [Halobacterium salinarum]|uniref:Helicase-like protein n=1 Tax=Halobacterium salinarum (strain ATCC 33171 / DSM 3754 / JCM 8978 / NBRC 102687 / NCIMB 764 / 91-R6) TaxID=2597657 RepID=A0A4D6GWE4_HALS9|nr:AAA domain-containing protein [Halobacterium salinarum]QCC46164.1 helicase-like protein [Halobacterium salinarum]TYO73834.1 hypothetical protein APQ99_02372 [Halobacterium salinarum DSM 3754]
MVRELFNDWRYEDAELLSVDTRNAEYEAIDVERACSQAAEQLDIWSSERDGYIVPVFEKNKPTPTNEYIIYRPEKGHVGWYDAGLGYDGAKRFAECHRLDEKVVGQRLWFWLPENRSDPELAVDESELPANQVDPFDRLSSNEQDAFFEDLKAFVQSERASERDNNWEAYEELGLQEAIRRNQMSGPFVPVSRTVGSDGEPAYNYQFVPEEDDDDDSVDLRDDEGIFEQNRCIIDTETGESQFPLEVEVTSVKGPHITIQPAWESIDDRNAVEKLLDSDETELWLHDLLNPVPFERRLKAIKQVKRNPGKRDLLTGKRPVEYTVNKYALPEAEIELNDYQRMAMIWADGANDVACIHGPPGTGKTRTLTAYVRYAVSQGESVLVTAHSNQAVDNLLVGDSTLDSPEEDTLHAMAQSPESELSIARVGSNSRSDVVRRHYADQSTRNADIVAATTSGSAQFDPDTFDVAVVDEATQASRPATAIVLNSAKKLVLAGDHKQLPPYCASETMQEEDMHISLFEYLLERYDDQISVLLRKQYRMNDKIAEFPNESFYNGELETAARNQDWTVEDLQPLMAIDIDGEEQRRTHGNSYYNPQEAEAVAKQVKLLVQHGLSPEDIGVISAYSGQVGAIGGRINQLDIDSPERVNVDTVDSFQGSEREAIVVSFVRSNDRGHSGFLEFPSEGLRRLNVAMTRARKRLVLVGDWNTLGTVAPHRTEEESCAPLYEELADQILTGDLMLTP